MKDWLEGTRGFLLGVLTALVSTLIVLGSFWLALTENGTRVALLPSPTASASPTPTPPNSPTPPPPAATSVPGAPTFTPSPTFTLTYTPTVTPTFPLVSINCAAPPGWTSINVELGDSLQSIAQQFGISPDLLAEANCMTVVISGSLPVDTVINVPAPTPTATASPRPATKTPVPTNTQPWCSSPPASWIRYTVQPGENLFRIGLKFGVKTSVLQYYNCIADPDRIRAGQVIYVPNVPTTVPSPTHTVPPTKAPTSTFTATFIPPTATGTIPPTLMPSFTPTFTWTPSLTPQNTATFTPTPTPSDTPNFSPTPLPTDTPTFTPPPTNTDTPEPTPLISPTFTPVP
jgi:LysM repeat protein